DRSRVADHPAEEGADHRRDDPADIDHDAEAEIPAETHARAAFAASYAFGKHRIDEQEEGDRLAQGRIVPDVFRQSGGIEDMPEIDGKDRQHDEPGLDALAEQLDADELAGTGIDGGAHQYGFLEGQPVIHGDGPEENAEGSRR